MGPVDGDSAGRWCPVGGVLADGILPIGALPMGSRWSGQRGRRGGAVVAPPVPLHLGCGCEDFFRCDGRLAGEGAHQPIELDQHPFHGVGRRHVLGGDELNFGDGLPILGDGQGAGGISDMDISRKGCQIAGHLGFVAQGEQRSGGGGVGGNYIDRLVRPVGVGGACDKYT